MPLTTTTAPSSSPLVTTDRLAVVLADLDGLHAPPWSGLTTNTYRPVWPRCTAIEGTVSAFVLHRQLQRGR